MRQHASNAACHPALRAFDGGKQNEEGPAGGVGRPPRLPWGAVLSPARSPLAWAGATRSATRAKATNFIILWGGGMGAWRAVCKGRGEADDGLLCAQRGVTARSFERVGRSTSSSIWHAVCRGSGFRAYTFHYRALMAGYPPALPTDIAAPLFAPPHT